MVESNKQAQINNLNNLMRDSQVICTLPKQLFNDPFKLTAEEKQLLRENKKLRMDRKLLPNKGLILFPKLFSE